MPIPLPALGIQAPQQTDILGQAAKLRQFQAMGQEQQLRGQQIQAGQLENQMRQRDLQDQQTTMQILGKHGGDLESALPELASSVSAKTFLGLQKSAVDLKKSTAELDNKTLENKKLQSDQFLGLIDSATKMDPATYQQSWPQIAARALEIEPQLKGHVDPAQPVPQQALQQYGTLFQTQSSAMAKEAAKRSQAEEDRKAQLAPSELAKSQADAQVAQNQAAMGGGKDDTSRYISQWLQEHNLPPTAANWMKAHKAYTDETKVQPGVLRMQVLANTRPVQVIDPNNPENVVYSSAGDAIKNKAQSPQSIPYQTEKGVQREFTVGTAAKNLTAFNTAIEHSKQLQEAADALQNNDVRGLNKIGNNLGYQFGEDKMTNFNVIKNALSGEISKVFKGGQATDAEIKEVQGPFDSANSPAQLKGAINNAIKLMNSKRDALKEQYDQGLKAKPNFGSSQPGASPTGGDFFSNFGGKAKQ